MTTSQLLASGQSTVGCLHVGSQRYLIDCFDVAGRVDRNANGNLNNIAGTVPGGWHCRDSSRVQRGSWLSLSARVDGQDTLQVGCKPPPEV